MKRVLIAGCASLSLSGCLGSSCDGITPQAPARYVSMGASWVQNHSESVQQFANGASQLDLSLIDLNEPHEASEVALGIMGNVRTHWEGSVSAAPSFSHPLRVSLFPAAEACSPSQPRLDAQILSLQVLVDRSTISALTAGADVSHLFSVVASQKEATEGYTLMDWNSATDIQPDLIPFWLWQTTQAPAIMATTMLIFSEGGYIGVGEVAFTVVATLDNGEIFTFETDLISLD